MSQPPPQQGFGAPYEPQPGVYGEPAQPGLSGQPPQPSYGYPQFPTQTVPAPSGGPGGGGGGRSRGRVAGLVAAALAGVLVVGAGVWFVVGGDDGSDDKKAVAKESAESGQSDTEDGAKGGKSPTSPGPPSSARAQGR